MTLQKRLTACHRKQITGDALNARFSAGAPLSNVVAGMRGTDGSDTAFLEGGGETGALIRTYDWAATPLGPPTHWPAELRTIVGIMLSAAQPMFTAWGSDAHTLIYNDAYAAVMGPKHPAGLGQSFDSVWAEAMPDLEPLFQQVFQGAAIHQDDIALQIDRGDGLREAHFAFSYTPVRDATGAVVGLFCPCRETTEEIRARRIAEEVRDRQARLFMHAPGFIAILNGPDHRFEFVNDAYRRLIGNREFAGRAVREAIPELEGQGLYELLDQVYATGQRHVAAGMAILLGAPDEPAGRQVVVDFVYEPILDDNDHVAGIFVEGQETTAQIAAERASAQSDARFRAAVEAGRGVIWTSSPDGEMLGDQPGWAALTGQSLAHYEGYGWADAVHPDDARLSIDAWRLAVTECRPFAIEHRVRRHDGAWRDFSVRAIPSRDDDGAIIEWVGVHTDITDIRAKDAALRERDEHYRAAAELNPQVAWTATPDGQLDRVAERWQEWTGVSGLGDSWGEGIHPEDLDYSGDAWMHSVSTGVHYDVEHRIARTDGSFRWARSRAWPRRDHDGRIVKWYGSTEDVDDEKQVQARLHARDIEFRGVAEAMPGFVWTADDQGGIEYTSPTWHAYSGSTPEENMGAGWAGFVHPDDQPAAFERWAASLVSGEPYEVEFRLRDRAGAYHWWLARAQQHQDGRTRWVGTATELDEIVAARETLALSRESLEREVEARTIRLRETEEQLRQAQKLEAIGQLTGGVAHDFNNLLTVIRGSIDLLRRPGLSEDRRDRYMAAIDDTVTRATKLTGQLLAFARRQALQPLVFDAVDSVAALHDMIGTLTGSRIRVEIVTPGQPCLIDADPSQFDTALVNMIVNARDAMNSEGTLTITLARSSAIPKVRAHPDQSGDFVAISIADTGSGIDARLIDQIFEPFYTTKGVGQGTGLGLSQVYGFARQSGGEVRVVSEQGIGTVFTLYLPRSQKPVTAPDLHNDADGTITGQGAYVLVVEDNHDVGIFAKQALTELGFNTVFADDAQAALDQLARGADRFDVVFSDVMMPGMNGLELGAEINRRHPGLPVVLTSGYAHVLAKHGNAGFELLHKPYSLDQLSRVLHKAVAVRR